jgi:arginine decarboxylase
LTTSSLSGPLPVLRATCTGATTLAAFHHALTAVDLGHYNLVRLSSVVPPGVGIDPSAATPPPTGVWGDRLFCVYAEQRTSTPGEEAWAGVGWVQRVDGGGGLLVEHEGGSEGFVNEAILTSLRDMVAGEQDAFTEPELVTTGGRCHGEPLCALVIVPFQVVPWVDVARTETR